MSRSYKRTPIFQDGYGSKSLKWYKRQANKKVRRTKEVPSRKGYRKAYDTWTFRDYVFRRTLNYYRIEMENDFKHHIAIYGGINAIPNWLRKQLDDKNYRLWKRTYYWK